MDNNYCWCWNCGGALPSSTGKRKRRYCNDACRMVYKRKTEQPKANTIKAYPDTCRYCDTPIVVLTHPRKYPGACYECALAHADRPKTIDDLWPQYRYEQVKMTNNGLVPVTEQDLAALTR